MGKEQSKGRLPQISGRPVEVTESYVLYEAKLKEHPCSVFSGSPSPPLLSLSNNLKTHRHPNIVKYVDSGTHDNNFYIVTEPVKPLFTALAGQTSLKICVGLHSITSALLFLHEKAQTSHNNVCTASIFVTDDGSWKLGGLEFMCNFSTMSSHKLLEMTKRYENALAPEEKKGKIIPSAVDVYALGVLINDLLGSLEKNDLTGLDEIKQFCHSEMLQVDPKKRASLREVFNHPFFNHDFIRIHKFLSEIPLRNTDEKLVFFRELENHLRVLPEDMVASQLIHLLLARVVVMEPTAQNILPVLLCPKSDGTQDGALFSDSTFKQYVVPKILQMFCVRDTSVRLLLLRHLQSYIRCFTREQLQSQLLPELLVGIKDESDELVASTLHALAFMVGVLGGAAVVGGRRARLFSDGRPGLRRPRPDASLPERLSPDGGEDSVAEDTEAWSDWEQTSERISLPVKASSETESREGEKESREPTLISVTTLADLEALDIKSAASWKKEAERGPDFFSDMEPVISRPQMAVVQENKFMVSEPMSAGDAWESFDDWGDDASNQGI